MIYLLLAILFICMPELFIVCILIGGFGLMCLGAGLFAMINPVVFVVTVLSLLLIIKFGGK
jgi:hypothetical protein